MPTRNYADLGDLIRDLDQEGFSDDSLGAGFDDEDLALLGQIDPDRPAPARKTSATKKAASKTRRKPAAKKPRAE